MIRLQGTAPQLSEYGVNVDGCCVERSLVSIKTEKKVACNALLRPL